MTFPDKALGDLITLQRGFDITKDQQQAGSVPIVSSSGIASLHNESKVKAPGVVIGRKGSLGTVHYLSEDFWPHDTTLWVKDFKGNEPRFVSYFLKTLHLEVFDTGSSNPTLNRNHAHKIRVQCPPPSTQTKIAAILSACDDLIASNQRRIALLEGMAEEIYREWFVRMRYPGASTAAMNKGLPVDWSRKKLDALLVESKRPLKTADLSTVQRYVGLEHIPRKRVVLDAWGLPESVDSDKLRFEVGEMLFGKIRPYLHKVSIAPFSGACSTDTIVLKPRQQATTLFAYFTVFSDTFIDLATASSNGTKMPRANWNFLKGVEVTVPPDSLLGSFNRLAKPMIEQATALLCANERLAETRDSLLPRLISGKLKVDHLDIRLPPGMRAETEAVA